MKLYSITLYPPSAPSKLAEMSIHELETRETKKADQAFYFGWDDEEKRIEARLQALDELRLTY